MSLKYEEGGGNYSSSCPAKQEPPALRAMGTAAGAQGRALQGESLLFAHKYLKTINFGQQLGKKYMKGKLISI